MKIRIGSRESRLAIIQSEIVGEYLRREGHQTELVTMKTTGDLILDKTLDKIGGKGLFVKELDCALLEGRIDIAVHSYKDLPMELDARLPVVAASPREDPRDALILPQGTDQIDISRPIGCSSARRALQLKRLYPHNTVIPLRGNVLTRLDKLDNGEYAAIVLAMAGLKRLGLASRANRVFTIEEMLPAACQGILAVQARPGFDAMLLAGFNDTESADAALAERAFVAALNGGCSSPITAYAELEGDKMTLTGLWPLDNGDYITKSIHGGRADGLLLGRALAEQFLGGAL